MNWIEIVVMVVGAFGGVTGLLSLYTAKSKKDTLDIGNLRSLIDAERTARETMAKEWQQERIGHKTEVLDLRSHIGRIEASNQSMLVAIYKAYRCRFPEQDRDCPVIQWFQQCESCKHKEDNSCS